MNNQLAELSIGISQKQDTISSLSQFRATTSHFWINPSIGFNYRSGGIIQHSFNESIRKRLRDCNS